MSNTGKWMRWLQLVLLAFVAAAIIAPVLFPDRLPGVPALVEQGFVAVVVAIVGFGVLGLGWQALADLKRSPTEDVTGPVELSLQARRPVLVGLVLLLVLGGFAFGGWYFAQSAADPESRPFAGLEWHLQLMAGLFVLVWAVALLGSLSMLLHRAPFFVLTPRGFLYAPGGVSPGFVRWEDVTSLRETDILSGRQRLSPTIERVLAVGLRDPAKYRRRYNPLLGLLARFAGGLYGAQTGGAADLLINPTDFGARYEEIKARMEALHAEARR